MIFVCALATGSQWDFVQVFAWGRMIADHARSMSVSAAVSQTFGGEMCSLCRMVAEARHQEQSRSATPDGKVEGKILIFFQAAPRLVLRPRRVLARLPEGSAATTWERSAPPLPPPRFAGV